MSEVFVGGTLIGRFGPEDRGVRNALLAGLSSDPKMHLGQLAEAFEVSSERLRQVRRAYEQEGEEALWMRGPGGSETKVLPAQRARLERLFEDQATVSEAYLKEGKRFGLSRATVGRVRQAWLAKREAEKLAAAEGTEEKPGLVHEELPFREAGEAGEPPAGMPAPSAAVGSDEEDTGAEREIGAGGVRSGRFVQHVGNWLLLGVLERLGLYRQAEVAGEDRVDPATLRISIDAAAMALALKQQCVEGVRRLATPTAPLLLRATEPPSASWVRRVLGRFARDGGAWRIHLRLAGEYLRAAQAAAEEPLVFYIDNHLRPYTGKQVLRRGWRMQDKRVRPGTTDYYVHDEDGRPVLRVDVPQHDGLTDWLRPVASLLRAALPEERMLVAFDRAGAYPEHLATLREEQFDFVTYERRPFPVLGPGQFTEHAVFGKELLAWRDARTNLGAGKGRVRRISVRTSDGRQVNLLAVSQLPARKLIEVMHGRWNQENGFKHGVERWGLNQLDGRTTRPYEPDTVIPNPARRRLDAALRLEWIREGLARRELALRPRKDPKRIAIQRQIKEAMALQRELEALRPEVPTHAPLQETELAGKLVKHAGEYKAVVDTIRIACANAESELAAVLSRHLRRPRKAKKALANLFAAPGRVHTSTQRITVTLQPAGTRSEHAAFHALLRQVNRWRLVLPGDPSRRPLRFQSQLA